MAGNGEDEHVTRDLGDGTPPPSPDGKDDDDSGTSLRDETPSQTTPSTRTTRKTIRVPSLRDETPSQPTPSTRVTRKLTRSRRLSQAVVQIVEDNVATAVPASRKKTPRAQTPYKEAPPTESMDTHPARKNTRPPSTTSTLAATGIASRVRCGGQVDCNDLDHKSAPQANLW
ncbi:hypothetical protein CJ030_MR7G002268 [Morella rubra]|uniref:Uncharacterized protein n=1 Tax=Morella rubra TaxID=262757 RepID=A0A6A1V1P3_9ROSI|nr:hypothetical protein CJ030_MR7G002268 [Morella rubra]